MLTVIGVSFSLLLIVSVVGEICPNGTRSCSSEKSGFPECIPDDFFCNFVQDCQSGSGLELSYDELNCGACDFRSTTCGWESIVTQGYEWVRSKSTALNHSGESWKMTLNESEPDKVSDTLVSVSMQTPILGSSNDMCRVQFKYLVLEPDGYLVAGFSMQDKFRQLMKINSTAAVSGFWQTVDLDINDLPRGFRLQIIGGVYHVSRTRNSNILQIEVSDFKYVNCFTRETFLPISCDFRLGKCGWYEKNLKDFNSLVWRTSNNSALLNAKSMPSNLNFIYIKRICDGKMCVNKGEMRSSSQKVSPDMSYCLSFDIFVNGEQNFIRLYSETNVNHTNNKIIHLEREIFPFEGNWLPLQIPIKSHLRRKGLIKLTLEIFLDNTTESVAAIKDMKLETSNIECALTPAQSPTHTTTKPKNDNTEKPVRITIGLIIVGVGATALFFFFKKFREAQDAIPLTENVSEIGTIEET